VLPGGAGKMRGSWGNRDVAVQIPCRRRGLHPGHVWRPVPGMRQDGRRDWLETQAGGWMQRIGNYRMVCLWIATAMTSAAFAQGCAKQAPDSSAFASDITAVDVANETGSGDVAAKDGAAAKDAAADGGPVDVGVHDVAAKDVAAQDGGTKDVGVADVGPLDAGDNDVGAKDIGNKDAGGDDAGNDDSGSVAKDVSNKDTGQPDAGGCPKSCDDGKVCTTDLCNPSDGTCSHKPHTGACDDGDPCTLADKCVGGACKGGPSALYDRLLQVTGEPGGGCVAESGGQVVIGGRSDGRATLIGVDASGFDKWTTQVDTLDGEFLAVMERTKT